jgi:predicted N-formylglutamate amidohydrolase
LEAWAQTRAGRPFTPAVSVENAGGEGRFVIVCDHASNRFPAEFGFLGLPPEAREAHIAWDPGALGVARYLSGAVDAPLIHATVSRLVIDCNRAPDAADLIAVTSETTAIPGNAQLTAAQRRERVAAVHEPYHAAIDELLEERLATGRGAAMIALHSFTPVYCGKERPWDVGILFSQDRRIALPLIEALKACGFNVGVNQPYSPADGVYYTLSRHAESRGLACAMIEIRNDLIRQDPEQRRWAGILAAALGATEVGSEALEGSAA